VPKSHLSAAGAVKAWQPALHSLVPVFRLV
jgi:hypothetical protein